MLNPDERGDVKLYGPHHSHHNYGFSDEAVCSNNKPCTNFEGCSCGFYGYNLIDDALEHWRKQCSGEANVASVLVQVAFSGKVVVCEKGYRASHQRVKKILLNRCCLCENTAEMITPHENGDMVPLCTGCFNSAKVKHTGGFFKKKSNPVERPAIPALTFSEFAERHSPTGFNPMQLASIPEFEDKEKVNEFFGISKLFTFLPGENSGVPVNFPDYLSTLNQKDMDKMLSLISSEMGKRMMSGEGDSL